MKTVFSIIILLLSGNIYSQTNTETSDKPYIEVMGVHEQEIIPDEIYIKIILRERYENKEKLTIELQEQKLKIALKEIGIEIKNLSLANANADYIRIKIATKDVITEKEYILKVTNAEMIGKVFKELDKLNIKDAFIDNVRHSKIDSLRKESRILAIKNAKENADYLLISINQQCGAALIISEFENKKPNNNHIAARADYAKSNRLVRMGDGPSPDDTEVVEFQKIKIQTSIYVKFLIKQ